MKYYWGRLLKPAKNNFFISLYQKLMHAGIIFNEVMVII